MWKNEIRELIPSLSLLTNSIVWFSLSWFVIQDLIAKLDATGDFNTVLMISSAYFGALIISAILGATLLKKYMKRKSVLTAWISVGAVVSILISISMQNFDSARLTLVSLPLGALAGLGIPTCFAMFAEVSPAKNRGLESALVFFLIQGLTAVIFLGIGGVNVEYKFLILAAWRFVGLFSVFLWKPKLAVKEEFKIRLSGIIRERTFFLYFIPWFLFTIVNFVEQPLLEHFFTQIGADVYNNYTVLGIVASSISAFLGGALCDFKGRKVSGILGFVILGIGYAFLSVSPNESAFQIVWALLDGVAWGILYVTFIFVIWGDISDGRSREQYYLLGCMPFLLSNPISALVVPFVGQLNGVTASFSVASFFLFIAIMPLLYAPETLPEKVMKDRDLKSYVEKAKKKVEQDSQKPQRKESSQPESEH